MCLLHDCVSTLEYSFLLHFLPKEFEKEMKGEKGLYEAKVYTAA